MSEYNEISTWYNYAEVMRKKENLALLQRVSQSFQHHHVAMTTGSAAASAQQTQTDC